MTEQEAFGFPHPASGSPGPPLFKAVLVANRGEIACRVLRTLRILGIRSVAVYSDADAGARHVREADSAVRIGPAAAVESYLNIDAILRACRKSGADAVHPGYGFLSENAAFARALEQAGITFIGPAVTALDIMGNKIQAKNHVAGYGVPVVPGVAEPGMTDEELCQAAPAIGFPLLIKPSAGGGGKGMHVVHGPEELKTALATARRIAVSAFGDGTLFLERLVPTPRHLEVQVLADTHGNVIHLGERECSLQRRHQKVIEEAPSPLLEALPNGAALRARMGEAACQAARSVNYSGAGTVEFLVSDASPGEFYFMEMNTRLQVEHAVTEMATGIDLVEWQVRIAAGEELTVRQDDVELTGHAVEARVYAEVPENNFLPSTGTVLLLKEPGGGSDPGGFALAAATPAAAAIRVDSCLQEGLSLSSSYDPMLSKVIAWAEDRDTALAGLDRALAGYTVLGISTNVEYLRLLISDPDVRSGRLDTGLIERKLPALEFRKIADPELVAAALWTLATEQKTTAGKAGPWNDRNGWRLGTPAPRRISLATPDGAMAVVSVSAATTSATSTAVGVVQVSVDDGPARPASLDLRSPHLATLTLNGDTFPYVVATALPSYESGPGFPGRGVTAEVSLGDQGWSCKLEILDRESRLQRVLAVNVRGGGEVDPAVRAPMPGTVVSVAVQDGEEVAAGQPLATVEAMKMEHQLVAPLGGTVHLATRPGELVKANQVLATIKHVPTPTLAKEP